MLKNRLKQILAGKNLDAHRMQANNLATELGIGMLDLSAALLCLNMGGTPEVEQKANDRIRHNGIRSTIQMVRYRLDVGSRHLVTAEQLTKILVDESGVDKNNISGINIQGLYTLVELPDNMPQDIFLHLKSVEINHRKLDIRRVKAGNKKRREKKRSRRGRQAQPGPLHGVSDLVNGQ